MTTVLVVLVLLAALVIAGLGWVVVRQRRRYGAANRLLPDVPSRAPAEWAGAHSPEARLHRRLRDALAALRRVAAVEDGSLLQLRVDIEQEALAADDRLIAAAALPQRLRAEPFTQLEHAVTAIEDAVGTYASAATQGGGSALRSSVESVRSHLAVLARIRTDSAGLPPP
jgi:hypothetical protein